MGVGLCYTTNNTMDSSTTFRHWRFLIAVFVLILLISLIIWLAFTTEIKSVFKPRSIEIKNSASSQNQPAENQEPTSFWPFEKKLSQPLNFLLLGAPGAGNDASDLTDTILLARLDEAKNKIYLFSLPRDLLVKIPESANFTKLNALYAFNRSRTFSQEKVRDGQEFNALIKKTQDITGLEINHYIFVDLQTVRQLVDLFGGVNIMVAKDIIDDSFPGPNHSFETFTLKAGWRYLDGQTALKYMRTRHSLSGDFDRVTRQQEVLQALKQKVLALNFWDIGKFIEIYNALSSNIKSDLSLWQIKSYWDKIKGIPGENVIKNELNNQNLLVSGQMNLGGEMASVLQPKLGVEKYDDIKKYIAEIISN